MFSECRAKAAPAAQYGRGMAAIDALITLGETRLRAARWSGAPPIEIDRVAEELQTLRAERERWTHRQPDLEPVYAVTAVQGAGHARSVDRRQLGIGDELVGEAERPGEGARAQPDAREGDELMDEADDEDRVQRGGQRGA